jgi:hypothetical protein
MMQISCLSVCPASLKTRNLAPAFNDGPIPLKNGIDCVITRIYKKIHLLTFCFLGIYKI